MEEKPLPPASSVQSLDESNSLDMADANAPVSSYSVEQKTYPIETLEVRNEGEAPAAKVIAPKVHATAFSRRRAMIISLSITLLVVVLTGLAVTFVVRNNTSDDSRLQRDVPTQGVTIDSPLPADEKVGLLKEEGSLLVNGDIVSSGTIRVTNEAFASIISTEVLTGDQAFVLPDASGTICLDVNNCNFATEAQQAALQAQIAQLGAQIGQIVIPDIPAVQPFEGVDRLNGQNGTISIQGTTNRISITTNNGVVRISTPQDLAAISSPTFSSLLLTGGLTVNGPVVTSLNCSVFANGGALTTNASGQIICSDDDGGSGIGVTTPGGVNGTIPLFTGTQTIGNSILTQTGTTVHVGGSLALANALSVAYGGTGLTAVPMNGQLLIGNGSGYNLAALTQGAGISITNGAGSITISATLGTEIVSAEIVDGTILELDLSTTNAPTDNYILSYDQASGGFTWVDPSSLGGPNVTSLNSLTGALTLQGTAGKVAVTDNGAGLITLDLNANVSLLGQSIGTSEIENNAVILGTLTSGDYVAGIGALTGLSVTGNGGEGSTPALSVLYGSTMNTAVRGNTSINCSWGMGNLQGGGNNILLGNGGSCGPISIIDNPTFGISVTTPMLQSSGALNISSSGAGNNITITSAGQIMLNAAGTIELLDNTNVTGALVVSSTVLVGDTIGIGTSGIAGKLTFTDGASNTGTLRAASLSTERTYMLPDADGTICLTSGNCAGVGGGITGSGGADRIAKFGSTGTTIGDSSLSDNGSLVTVNGNVNLEVQGTTVSVGVSSSRTGSIVLRNSINSNTVTIQSGATSASYTLTLPSAVGATNQCLKAQNGTGTLYWDNCLGGSSASGITSIAGQNGPSISINNATGAGNVITIDDAAADGATKGIAAFNATNFISSGGVINTAQGISTSATPQFAGLTLTGNINIGSNVLQGTTAAIDFANFSVASDGNTIIGGALSVEGLTTLNGGLTLEVGDTFTINGDAFTDLTGNGLQVSSNALTLAIQAGKGLEVDANGLSLIDCSAGEILKYNGSSQWVCAADAGSDGVGDSVSINGVAATDVNLLDAAATATTASTTWSLNSLANPNEVTLTIGSASATEAGVVTTLAQTFSGDKTFNDQITASGGINLGGSTLQGGVASIDFANFDVSSGGDVSASGSLEVSGIAKIGNSIEPTSAVAMLVMHQFDNTDDCTTSLCSGIYSYSYAATSETGADLSSITAAADVLNGHSVDELVGLRVLWNGLSGGTVVDNYGIFVHTQANGTNSNYGVYIQGASTYSLYVASGATRLEGTLQVVDEAIFGDVDSQGLLHVHDGNGNMGTLHTASLSSDRTYILPDADGTICLTSGNCIGTGGAAPAGASYLLLGADPNLTNERVLTLGGNLTATDGGANGVYAINTVSNPTFGTSVTTPVLQSTGALAISNSGMNNNISITSTDQIIMSSVGAIELQNNTNVTGDIAATGRLQVDGVARIGNSTEEALSAAVALQVVHEFNELNSDCDSTACAGIISVVAAGDMAVQTFQLAAFMGQVFVQADQELQSATGMYIGPAGGDGLVHNNYGISVSYQSAGENNYGLFIEGADSYSLYVASGASHFNGTLEVVDVATFGTASTAGSLRVHDGSSHTGTIQTANLTTNRTYLLPDADGTICLTSGNCLGGAGGAAPANASYLTLATNGNLTNERALTLGTNLTATDAGANGNYTLATVGNPTFGTSVTTPILQSSGALTVSSSGAGNDVTITSTDQIILNAAGTIELQDNTNITGNLAVDGNTFNVNATNDTIGLGRAASANEILSFQGSDTKIEIYSAGEHDFEIASDGAVYISIDNNNSDASDDGSPAFNIVANGDYSNPLFWMNQKGDAEIAGSLFVEKFLTLGVDALTIPSNGSGTPASYTLEPLSSYVEITCNDPQGCDIVMDTSASEKADTLILMNVGTNVLSFADTPGTQELAGNFSGMGQYDTLTLIFTGSRWVETSRSDN